MCGTVRLVSINKVISVVIYCFHSIILTSLDSISVKSYFGKIVPPHFGEIGWGVYYEDTEVKLLFIIYSFYTRNPNLSPFFFAFLICKNVRHVRK